MRSANRILEVVLCVALALCLIGCEERGAVPSESEIPDVPDQEIESFTLTQTRDGEREWVLTAKHASIYESTDTVEARDLRIEFYESDGTIASVLTANTGSLDRKTNDMEAVGNVVLSRSDETTLRTQRLRWSESRGKIETDDPVQITKGDDVMTGDGLVCDVNLENIKVKRNFRAYVRTETGELVEEE